MQAAASKTRAKTPDGKGAKVAGLAGAAGLAALLGKRKGKLALKDQKLAQKVDEKFKRKLMRAERIATLSGRTVFIDIGRGGEDVGAIASDGTQEKHLTGKFAGHLQTLLEDLGVKVVLSRPTEDDASLKSGSQEQMRRTQLADESKADVVVRLFANAADPNSQSQQQDAEPAGMESLWAQTKDLRLSQVVHDAIADSN